MLLIMIHAPKTFLLAFAARLHAGKSLKIRALVMNEFYIDDGRLVDGCVAVTRTLVLTQEFLRVVSRTIGKGIGFLDFFEQTFPRFVQLLFHAALGVACFFDSTGGRGYFHH